MFIYIYDDELRQKLLDLGWQEIKTNAKVQGIPIYVFKYDNLSDLMHVDNYKYKITSRLTVWKEGCDGKEKITITN